MNSARAEEISQEVFALLGTGHQINPFSQRYDGFNLEEAYDVVERVRELRETRGEKPIGRKIGFTNRAVWGELEISAPIWNYVFDRTVVIESAVEATFNPLDLPEPRIEPEIVLHLGTSPRAGMNETELFACLDWFAAGYEIVYSIFPGWRFSAADAAAAYGVHGSLFVGAKQHISGDRTALMTGLASFHVEMTNDQGDSRRGHARNVLGGPLQALKYLVEEIAQYPASEPLRIGELITTGTLTEAMPAIAGEAWTTRFVGVDLQPLHLRFG
jgi:2-oxo-3-hexenedioate decarboxylase